MLFPNCLFSLFFSKLVCRTSSTWHSWYNGHCTPGKHTNLWHAPIELALSVFIICFSKVNCRVFFKLFISFNKTLSFFLFIRSATQLCVYFSLLKWNSWFDLQFFFASVLSKCVHHVYRRAPETVTHIWCSHVSSTMSDLWSELSGVT